MRFHVGQRLGCFYMQLDGPISRRHRCSCERSAAGSDTKSDFLNQALDLPSAAADRKLCLAHPFKSYSFRALTLTRPARGVHTAQA